MNMRFGKLIWKPVDTCVSLIKVSKIGVWEDMFLNMEWNMKRSQ